MSRWSDAFTGALDEPEAELQPVGRWSDVFEPSKAAPPKPKTESNGNFISRTVDAIRGKQDPAYKDVPALDDGGSLPFVASTAIGKLSGQDDAGYGDIMQKSLGDKFLRRFKDANGYDLIEWNDNGTKRLGYVNKPGLDLEDVSRGLMGVVPYIASGGATAAITKGAPIALRGLAQAGANTSTSMLGDMTASAVGSDQGIDVGKAVTAGLLGGAAEVLPSKALMAAGGALAGGYMAAPEMAYNPATKQVEPQSSGNGMLPAAVAGGAAGLALSALTRRFMMAQPGKFATAEGKLTEEGADAARRAGVDPEAMTAELAKEFDRQMVARGGNPAAAAPSSIAADARSMRIPVSKGELTRDREQLLKEQHIRSGNYGTTGKDILTDLDTRQAAAIKQAATDLGSEIAPSRAGVPARMADLGEDIRGSIGTARATAAAEEKAAWKEVPDMRATPEALAILPERLNRSIGNFPVPEGGKAAVMARDIDAFMKGEAPAAAAEWMKSSPTFSVVEMRKRLRSHMDGATDKTDMAAARAIYRGFDDWTEEAAKQQLLGGDPMGAVKQQTARSITARLHEVFDGERGTAAANIIKKVTNGADSGEQIVNGLFTGATGQLKNGSVDAVKRIFTAFDRHLPKEEARAAKDTVGLALWTKISTGKDGELLGSRALASSIKNYMGSHASLMREVFKPQTMARMMQFSRVLEATAAKNPNTSWSGVSAAGFLKDAGNALLAAIGGNTWVGKMLITGAMKPIQAVRGQVAARDAVSQDLPKQVVPSLGGYGGAAGQAINPLMQDR